MEHTFAWVQILMHGCRQLAIFRSTAAEEAPAGSVLEIGSYYNWRNCANRAVLPGKIVDRGMWNIGGGHGFCSLNQSPNLTTHTRDDSHQD